MNRDDIIRWAQEAGLETHPRKGEVRIGSAIITGCDSTEQVMRFANLVAAAEREACKKACIELKQIGAEAMFGPYWDRACVDCANAIDARGDK